MTMGHKPQRTKKQQAAVRKKREAASKPSKPAIHCANRMQALLRDLEETPPFESVDIDMRRECKDEWNKDYAIAIFTIIQMGDEEFFDEEACRWQFIEKCVEALGGSDNLTVCIRSGKPSRPWKVGDYVLQFHESEEIELYKLTQESFDAIHVREKREHEDLAAKKKQSRASLSHKIKKAAASPQVHASITDMDYEEIDGWWMVLGIRDGKLLAWNGWTRTPLYALRFTTADGANQEAMKVAADMRVIFLCTTEIELAANQ